MAKRTITQEHARRREVVLGHRMPTSRHPWLTADVLLRELGSVETVRAWLRQVEQELARRKAA